MKIGRLSKTVATVATALGVSLAGLVHHADAAHKRYKIYLSLSYTGNAWQSEAANIVKALAKTPPYNKEIELKEVISGTNVENQISAINSMVADGADAIIGFPISSNGLDKAIEHACKKGVKVWWYDGMVTAPCAYSVSYLDSGFGQNTAQYLVNLLHGKGKIFLSRGVAGNMVDTWHYRAAMSVFKKYPGIHIVAQYYGRWDDQRTQIETAKALAAHPNVDGIWAQAGEFGAVKAVLASGRKKMPFITGENSDGFRLALANPAYRKRGFNGVSSGSPPAESGLALKLLMDQLTHQRKIPFHNIRYPLPWVPANKVKICKGDRFENGCNTFPASKVPGSFVTQVFNPKLTPEISLESALHGTPTPGATIQPLPPNSYFRRVPNMPGVNCKHCKAPANPYPLTKVTPFDAK